MSTTSIIAKALGGGITGYITNDLAIKMLFRKYGPLGGVILETKEDFIKNTSELVEREIINHHTIEDELAKDEFRGVFENIIEDILGKYLYQNTEDNIRLSDIPELEQSFDNFLEFYEDNNQDFITDALDSLFDNIMVEDVVGVNQVEHISSQCLDTVIDTLEETNTIENLVNDLYYENSKQEVANFISPRVFKQVANNLKDSTSNFHHQLESKFEGQIDRTIDKLYRRLEISSTLSQVENQIQEKTFADLLGRDNTDNIANELLERTVRFLRSNEGRKLITKFLEDILDILKKIDLSLLELLNDDLQGNLEYFMENQLPDLVEKGIRWIKRNKREIEDLIEEAAQETLDSGSGVKNWIKKQLKDIFMGNIAREFEVVDKIVTGIEDGVDIRKLSKEVTKEIIDYIKDNSIGEIIQYLDDKNVIRIKDLTRMIDKNIDQIIGKLDLTQLDYLFETKIGKVINIELKQYFEDNIKGMLIKKFKDEFLFTKRLTKTVQREISNRVLDVVNLELEELISAQKVDENLDQINEQVLAKINKNKEEVLTKIIKTINDFISNKRFSDLITNESRDEISKEVERSSTYYLQDQISELKYQEVTDLYDKLNKKKDLTTNLTDLILDLVNQNLSDMIEGKIEGAVADNLSKLPDEKIQDMVEEFMGTELKPITLLGSILGFGSAIGLYFGQGAMSGSIPAGLRFGLSIFAYGAVGYITNVIALKMIFRPYEEKEFLGMKVPFTPGVITKKKPKFANSMADFVDDELLNSNAVDEIFKTKRDGLEINFKETISNNNYQMLQEMLENNNEFIAEKTFYGTLNFVGQKQKEIINQIMEQLGQIDLGRFDTSRLESELKQKSKEALLNTDDLIEEYLEEGLNNQQSIKKVMPDSLKEGLTKELDKLVEENVRKGLEFIGDKGKIDDLVRNYSEDFDEIVEKKVNNLISTSQQKKLKGFARDYFLKKIRSIEVRDEILNLIEEKFLQEVRPQQKISQLFDGRLMDGVHNNTNFIIDQLFDKANEYLQAERSSFKRKAIDKIDESIEQEKSSGVIGWLKGTAKSVGRSATDADDTVEDVIDNLVDYKFPKFLKQKEDEFREEVNKFLSRMERKRVGDIGIDLDRQGVENIVDGLVENDILVNHLTSLLDGTIDSVLEVRLKSLLRIVSITNLVDIVDVFAEEVDMLRYELSDNLYSKEETISKEVGSLLQDVFERLVLSIKVNQLSRGVDSADVSKSVKRILNNINRSDAFNNNLEATIKDIITEIQYQEIDETVEFNYLKRDIKTALQGLLINSQAKEDLLKVLTEITEVVVDNTNDIIEEETKDFVLDLGLESSLDSMEDHFLDLTNSVNVKEVTKQEINAMHPQEIEKLFDSFAAHYFKKLEHYGWLGAGIGTVAEIVALLG
ncbi:hypothetical protein JCM16358_08990 [Halanaerocella petrolearia]